MDISTYLERIGYKARIDQGYKTLCGLQESHMRIVPFENLDIGLKIPIQIHEEALWDKIVLRRRGGFCYELNGLFA